MVQIAKKRYDAIVIGAGPSGLVAAGRAGERGREVLLIEKNDMPGRKLLISGKGRCNISSAGTIDDYLCHFSESGVFLRNAFAKVFTEELKEFFESKGVPLKTERGRRVFPASDRAQDILRALMRYAKDNRVDLMTSREVRDIRIGRDGTKEIITADGGIYTSVNAAICTGGLSYPETGSTGFGFGMAKRLGHKVVPQRPALVPLVARDPAVKRWQGIPLKNVEAGIVAGGRKGRGLFGEMLFTHFGLSGPIILDLSAEVYDILEAGGSAAVSINFKPALDKGGLDKRLIREFRKAPRRSAKSVFKELLPSRLIEGFLGIAGIDPVKSCGRITRAERARSVEKLLDFRVDIGKTRPIEEAIVTRGGVDTREINPKTMESKIVKGLYFAGEVIDVDAKTGGYNMQAAFSTGFLCGENL